MIDRSFLFNPVGPGNPGNLRADITPARARIHLASAQISVTQIRALEVGSTQIRIEKISARQLCRIDVGTAQIGTLQLGSLTPAPTLL